MKDLLNSLHSITDRLEEVLNSYTNNSTFKENEFLFTIKPKEIVYELERELSQYQTPYYLLEAIYLSSPNFSNTFIEQFENQLSRIISSWTIVYSLSSKEYEENKDDSLEYILDILNFSETFDAIVEHILSDFYQFCNRYLAINNSRFIAYQDLKEIYIGIYQLLQNNNNPDFKAPLINIIEYYENAKEQRFYTDFNRPIREVLGKEDFPIIPKYFAVPMVSSYLFYYEDTNYTSENIKILVDYLSNNNICKISQENILSLLLSKTNTSKAKILWTGKKADAFRFKDFLNLSVSEFNNSFQLKDGKKLQNNHKSISGWSDLSSFLLKMRPDIR